MLGLPGRNRFDSLQRLYLRQLFIRSILKTT
jgi:hypothetical protein